MTWCSAKCGVPRIPFPPRAGTALINYLPTCVNVKSNLDIALSTFLVSQNNQWITMQNNQPGKTREIKPSLREFEAMLASEEKVSA